MKNLFLITLIFILIILNFSCQYFTLTPLKEWMDINNQNTDIYIGGNYNKGTANIPCYWKNGSQNFLPDSGVATYNSSANSIVIKSKRR